MRGWSRLNNFQPTTSHCQIEGVAQSYFPPDYHCLNPGVNLLPITPTASNMFLLPRLFLPIFLSSSVCLSVCLSACLSVCLPVCLSACLPMCLCMQVLMCLSQSDYSCKFHHRLSPIMQLAYLKSLCGRCTMVTSSSTKQRLSNV